MGKIGWAILVFVIWMFLCLTVKQQQQQKLLEIYWNVMGEKLKTKQSIQFWIDKQFHFDVWNKFFNQEDNQSRTLKCFRTLDLKQNKQNRVWSLPFRFYKLKIYFLLLEEKWKINQRHHPICTVTPTSFFSSSNFYFRSTEQTIRTCPLTIVTHNGR